MFYTITGEQIIHSRAVRAARGGGRAAAQNGGAAHLA